MTYSDSSTLITLHADEESAGERLDVYLASQLDGVSRTRVHNLIIEGKVLVDGVSVRPSYNIVADETIHIQLPPNESPIPEAEDIPLSIIYEDDDVLVIDKPVGLVVHPGAGIRTGTLVNALVHHCGSQLSAMGGVVRPGIVHRLDRQTSGCICVAKNDKAHLCLSEQLADRSMGRIYDAWVVGTIDGLEGIIDAPIGRSPRIPTRMAVVRRGGRNAVTHWKVVRRAPGLTRLECNLETGRTHQIRVHLAFRGTPIVGDPEYGLAMHDAKQRIPAGYPKIIQAMAQVGRPLLHAREIHFLHPRTGERMSFHAPLEKGFVAFDAALEPFAWAPPVAECEPTGDIEGQND
jgi:23S rRNA pseudouridine1911/1915/1917 synthase